MGLLRFGHEANLGFGGGGGRWRMWGALET